MDLAEKRRRAEAWRAFLARSEEGFTQLLGAYIQQVLRIVLHRDAGPYGIFHVGTRAHQDDVDVAVLDGGCRSRAELDQAVGRLAGQLLRFAAPADNYLAGAVGAEAFALGIEDLSEALRSGRLDWVQGPPTMFL